MITDPEIKSGYKDMDGPLIIGNKYYSQIKKMISELEKMIFIYLGFRPNRIHEV